MGLQARMEELAIEWGKATHIGRVRLTNEDSVWAYVPIDSHERSLWGSLFLVADGMGGHSAGEVASRLAVETVAREYYRSPPRDAGGELARAIEISNQAIRQEACRDPAKRGMGTTLVCALLLGRRALVANVGDSRAYLVRQGHIQQVSRDHSWVAEQVERGLLDPELAQHHPMRNVITRALGVAPAVEPQFYPEITLEVGDSLVLCSDGLYIHVDASEIASIVGRWGAQRAADELVGLANNRGGTDNITVIVVKLVQDADRTLKREDVTEVTSRSSL